MQSHNAITSFSSYTGTIGISVTGTLRLAMTMTGMWEKPFGLSFISFGNVMLSAAVNPMIPLPAFGKRICFAVFYPGSSS